MFRVLYSPGAAKALKKIPKEEAKRIVKSIDTLSEVDDPRYYIKKLKGSFGVPLYSLTFWTVVRTFGRVPSGFGYDLWVAQSS